MNQLLLLMENKARLLRSCLSVSNDVSTALRDDSDDNLDDLLARVQSLLKQRDQQIAKISDIESTIALVSSVVSLENEDVKAQQQICRALCKSLEMIDGDNMRRMNTLMGRLQRRIRQTNDVIRGVSAYVMSQDALETPPLFDQKK